ncbi:MAG: alpha/beta hydrolase-fold protein [Eubacteriales bacterium]|jgi:enterochelin esterase-like enzyme
MTKIKKEICENQVLRSQMLIFDTPIKRAVFKTPPQAQGQGPRPEQRRRGPLFGGHMPPMEVVPVEPNIKVYENGDVKFRFYAPNAQKVEVAGLGGGFSRERREMKKDEDGWWSITVSGILPGFHYHEYFVDGNRLVNPDVNCGYGCFYPINYFDLPSNEDEFWMLRDVPHGDVRMEYYKSSVNDRIKCAWVYCPPGYDSSDERYPVLYIQHGVGENETGWVWQGKINYIADNLIADGFAEKMIIVMNSGYAFKEGEDPVFFPGDFDSELVNDCIPYIDSKYRTKTDKRNRAVAGLSLGSSQAFLSAMLHRDIFGSLGVFSGGFPIKRGEYDFTDYFADAEKVNSDFDLIFVSGGEQEGFVERTLPQLNELRARGVKIVDYHRPGFHVWDVWRFSAYEFMKLLFK